MYYLVVVAACIGGALARPDGAGGHHHDHGAAAAPPTGYQQPAPTYNEPAASYEQPTGYAAPITGYEQTQYETGYSSPSAYGSSYGVAEEDDGGFGFNLFVIPILIIAGLALLFPSVTTVNVRRKREAGEEEVSGNSLVDRVQDIYMSVVQSEECLERVACEVGGIVADSGVSMDVFNVAGAFVPKKYSKMMKTFASGSDCRRIKCGTLF